MVSYLITEIPQPHTHTHTRLLTVIVELVENTGTIKCVVKGKHEARSMAVVPRGQELSGPSKWVYRLGENYQRRGGSAGQGVWARAMFCVGVLVATKFRRPTYASLIGLPRDPMDGTICLRFRKDRPLMRQATKERRN